MINQTKSQLFPDPFDEPKRYWHMIKNCPVSKEWQKRKQLKAVGLDFDVEPKLAELRRMAV